jgi:hypothetical protein
MKNIDNHNFFKLHIDGAGAPIVKPLNFRLKEAKCPGVNQKEYWKRAEILRVSIIRSSDLAGYIWPIFSGLIVPDDVRQLFIKKSITGISFSPVIIENYEIDDEDFDGDKFPENKLFHGDIIGEGGQLPLCCFPLWSRIFIRKCKGCKGYLVSENILSFVKDHDVFSLSQWDGSDCFSVAYAGNIYSARVIEILENNGVRNWETTPVRYIT